MEETRTSNPLLSLLELGSRARSARSNNELAFLLVNDTRTLLAYRQAALWFESSGIHTLSGVVQADAQAPYVQWLDAVCRELARTAPADRPSPASAQGLPAELGESWADWLPPHALWLPLPRPDPREPAGGLLLAGDTAFGDEALALLGEWLRIWQHAWQARGARPPLSLASLRWHFAQWRAARRHLRWWRRREIQAAIVVFVLLFCPVRLSVLAPGELVPVNPAIIRAPLDGVISKIEVQPNDRVRAGTPLFSFDEAQLGSRLDVARQSLATAETEYRQFAQMAVTDARSKEQLSAMLGKIGERRAEVEYLQGQVERARVLAPQDGIVLLDDPSEWIGRPVQTGERIMKLAQEHDAEIEAWLPVGDAIPLAANGPVDLYLSASPLGSVAGQLRYINHDASQRPDGTWAYRVRATLAEPLAQRIGLKGTVRLRGGWVPLCYWVLRRPLALARQFLAF